MIDDSPHRNENARKPPSHKTPSRNTVQVLLPVSLAGAYSYGVPDAMALDPGDFVTVPLGPRALSGIVWPGEAADPVDPAKLRDVAGKIDCPGLVRAHLDFIAWVAGYTLSPPGAVLRMTMRAPAALGPPPMQPGYVLAGEMPDKMTPQRRRVIDIAQDGLAWRAGDLAAAAGVSPAVVKGLADAGTLVARRLPGFAPFHAPDPSLKSVALSRAQAEAASALSALVAAGAFSATLLDGVTGSGKTEVYFEAIAASLAQAGGDPALAGGDPALAGGDPALAGGDENGQILVLLPEIALTPDFITRFEARFGARPAGWHSGMKPKDRERVWRAVADGSARIVVGARSSLFLPFANLRLIIVDEEHDGAFKQEDGVVYHARDMAVMRAKIGDFPVILASATPSLESLYNVAHGRYGHLRLDERHGAANLPAVSLIDMRKVKLPATRWLSPQAVAGVEARLAAGEQALLFLNRRGYAPLTLCNACGFRFQCPDCEAWLVEHRFRGELMCHHCGHRMPVPKACPACGAEESFRACGPGVERLAEEVRSTFPDARTAILSSDLVRTGDLHEMLRAIAAGAFDIVIGTQLVAKGHHFPNLTLACVVDADIGLAHGDPRAGERTYQLLRQVSGRAGRADRPGEALVQTHMPDHPLMTALTASDREAFYAYEREARAAHRLPPYGRLAALIVSGADQAQAGRFATALARRAPPAKDVQVMGPAPAPIALIRGRYRFRLLVRTARDVHIQDYLSAWLGGVDVRGGLRLKVDIDPYSFF